MVRVSEVENGQLSRRTGSKKISLCAALLAASALSACVSPVDVFTPLPADEVGRIGISQIDVTLDPAVASPDLEAILLAMLDEALRGCAVGDLQRRLTVQIDNFQEQNVAMTFLVGGSTSLSGRVMFVDPKNDRVVGDYYIRVGRGGGGILGAAIMGDARYNLPSSFAEEICDTIWGPAAGGARPVNVDSGGEDRIQTAKSQTRGDKARSRTSASQSSAAAESPPTTTQSAAVPVSVLEQGKIKVFMRRNGSTLRSRLRAYNQSHRIGQGGNSPSYGIVTIDSVDVLAVDGNRARIRLGFSSGDRFAPAIHKYIYYMRLRAGDIQIVAHRDPADETAPTESWLTAFQAEPASPAVPEQAEGGPPPTESRLTSDQDKATPDSSQTAVATTQGARSTVAETSEADRKRVMSFIRNHDNKVKSRLASYNESKRIGRENSPAFNIIIIDHIFARTVDGNRATVELGFSSGYRGFPSHHKYLYDVRLSRGDIVFLDHQKL